MWEETKTSIKHIGTALLFFMVKMAIAAIVVGADWALEQMASLVLEHDGAAFHTVEFVLDFAFVGLAVVIAISGGIVMAGEVLISSRDYFRKRLSK